jgi:anaerobic magnesium-protoporphyrin IX monomethyl ester cyclase
MREEVALIYPHFREKDPIETEKLFPPLGIACLKSQLSSRSIPSRVYDCTFSSFSEIVDSVERQQPAIVGIYIMMTMVRNATCIAEELRIRLPETLFVSGGPLPTLFPGRFSQKFDIVFCGEADGTFAGFCHDYLSVCSSPKRLKELDFSRYSGMYSDHAGKTINNPPIHNPQSFLNTLPLPDRSGFDHKKYQSFWRETFGYTQTNIIITRGCPYSCDFCSKPIWGDVYRKPPLNRVLEEIQDVLGYGYERLWIADDSFTLDNRYLREFCHMMIGEGVPVTWTCLSRVDSLSSELVGLMRKAGCVKVYLGLESGDDQTLRMMGKRATVADGRRAVSLFNSAGIGTAGFFMVGYPGETLESIEKTLSLAQSLPLDEISVNVPFPLPGSPLFERVSGIEDDAEWEKANEVKFIFCSEFDEELLKKRIMDTLVLFQEKREKRECQR